MAARFQRDIGRGPGRIVAVRDGIFHCLDFGVILASRLCISLPDHLPVFHQDATDARVRRGGEHAARRKCEGLFHGGVVGIGEHGVASRAEKVRAVGACACCVSWCVWLPAWSAAVGIDTGPADPDAPLGTKPDLASRLVAMHLECNRDKTTALRP